MSAIHSSAPCGRPNQGSFSSSRLLLTEGRGQPADLVKSRLTAGWRPISRWSVRTIARTRPDTAAE